MRKRSFGERPRSRDGLAAWYGAILEGQAKSGLSLRKYAARVGMSAWTLYEWRRRLQGAVQAEKSPRLVEVAVARPAGREVADLVVQVCDGRRNIAVPTGFDSDELRRVIATLESC